MSQDPFEQVGKMIIGFMAAMLLVVPLILFATRGPVERRCEGPKADADGVTACERYLVRDCYREGCDWTCEPWRAQNSILDELK